MENYLNMHFEKSKVDAISIQSEDDEVIICRTAGEACQHVKVLIPGNISVLNVGGGDLRHDFCLLPHSVGSFGADIIVTHGKETAAQQCQCQQYHANGQRQLLPVKSVKALAQLRHNGELLFAHVFCRPIVQIGCDYSTSNL